MKSLNLKVQIKELKLKSLNGLKIYEIDIGMNYTQFVDNNIHKIPYKLCPKKYQKNQKDQKSEGTIILISGTCNNHESWDNDKQYKSHKTGSSKRKMNLQQKLSKKMTTFSFTPFEYININIEEQNKKYQPVEPCKWFFDIKQIVYTMKSLIKLYDLKPPYTFIGFSEGGWRVLILQEHIPQTVKCILIDPQIFIKSSSDNIVTYNNYKKICAKKSKTICDHITCYKYKNLISKYKLKKINCPNMIILTNLSTKNTIDESELKYVSSIKKIHPQTTFYFFYDKIHQLHWLYPKGIINLIK